MSYVPSVFDAYLLRVSKLHNECLQLAGRLGELCGQRADRDLIDSWHDKLRAKHLEFAEHVASLPVRLCNAAEKPQ